MLRIVIFTGNAESSLELFEQSCEISKRLKTHVELSYTKDISVISQNIDACSSHYDIFIFDSANDDCLKLSQKIRSNNLNASFIYVTHGSIKQLLGIIKYRPSCVLPEKAGEKESAAALRYCISEQNRCRSYFTVKNRDSLIRISYDSISHFESNQRKVILHTLKQRIEFYGKLNDVEALLPTERFVRTHQSYLINMTSVNELDKTNRCFKLYDGSRIEISKSNYGQAVTKYEEYTAKY